MNRMSYFCNTILPAILLNERAHEYEKRLISPKKKCHIYVKPVDPADLVDQKNQAHQNAPNVTEMSRDDQDTPL